jgi:periplasmic protein CpxP/Spy
MREAKKESDVKPTAAEREAFKNEMKAEKDANDAKMKSILTADQYSKWHSLQDKNKDKAREKMKESKKENN